MNNSVTATSTHWSTRIVIMDRAPSDEALTETIKSLIISRNTPVTVAQLQRDYEELEGKKIPELKLQQLLKFNKVFHYLKPQSGQEERYDVRYGARMNSTRVKPQKKFNQPPVVAGRALKIPIVPRNRLPSNPPFVNNQNNNNNIYQKNFNGNVVKPMPKLTITLSERLKKKGELSPQDIEVANNLNIPDTWFISPGTSHDKLKKYCQMKNIDMPELKFLNNPLTKGIFKCQVTVNGKTYASYNDFFASKHEAEEASCKIAVNELKQEEELSRNPLDISNDLDIAQKIWQMIRSSIGGVFFKHISNLYIETYKLSLPQNWQQLLKPYDGRLFKREINPFNEEILFAIGDGSAKEFRASTPPSEPTQNIPELKFPWTEKLWNVFVTNAYSPTDICARLIGSEYSDALDMLLNDIEVSVKVIFLQSILLKIYL